MKKYKLKEEVKKYFTEEMGLNESHKLSTWESSGVSLEALEEVHQRIELREIKFTKANGNKCTAINSSAFPVEWDIVDKALNGELLDIDSLDDEDFALWYNTNKVDIMTDDLLSGDYLKGIKAVLKEYLKR